MCSRAGDEFEDAGVEELQGELKKKLDLKDAMCKKCSINKANVVLRVQDTYCTTCLQTAVTHKFRACLGKSKMMKSGEKVMIAYSGGQASTAMLKLTQDGLDITTHKRLRFVPVVIYIDEGALQNISCSSRIHALKEISSVTKTCDLPAFVSAIEMVMKSNNDELFVEMPENFDEFHLFENEDDAKRLRELFSSVGSLSSKEDLLLKLRYQLLIQIAISLGCSKILLGDSETRIAVRVLADIALGKGRNLAQNCGFADERHKDVILIRPMREILAKEISFFVNASKLPVVFQSKLTTKQSTGDSIQHRTEAFIFGLQKDFPATVSTIFRTADKMGAASPKSLAINKLSRNPEIQMSCLLCDSIVDKPNFIQARCCSTKGVPEPQKTSGDCSDCKCSSQNSHITIVDLMKFACHSCSLIFKEMSEINNIPPQVLEKAKQSLRRLYILTNIDRICRINGLLYRSSLIFKSSQERNRRITRRMNYTTSNKMLLICIFLFKQGENEV